MNENNEEKKSFNIKIAGFNIGIKHLAILGAIALVIGIIIASSNNKAKKNEQAVLDELGISENQTTAVSSENTTSAALSEDDKLQAKLIAKYGQPPEGYKWKDDGSLIAISSNDYNAEQVVYAYLQNVSMLNFA